MTDTPDSENGWERWRGEIGSDVAAMRRDIERVLEGQRNYLARCDEFHEALEVLDGEHKATRGLAWRGIVIATGAWIAVATIASWLGSHATADLARFVPK